MASKKKEAYYFPHEYNASEDLKVSAMIQRHGAAGYGVFWRIVELLHAEPEHCLPMELYVNVAIAKQLNSEPEFIEEVISSLVDFKLLESDGEWIWSHRVIRNFDEREKALEQRREAGRARGEQRKKEAEERRKKREEAEGKRSLKPARQDQAEGKREEAEPEREEAKERKGKESKGKESKEERERKKAEALASRSLAFKKQILEVGRGKYPDDMLKAFYLYWSEPNPSGTKMRKELEKTWDLSRRLSAWADREPVFKGTISQEPKANSSGLRKYKEYGKD